MKICIISNLYAPYTLGGADINTQRLARALNKDHEVLVLTTHSLLGIKSLFVCREAKERIRIYRFYPLNLYHLYFSKRRRIPSFVKVIWHIIDLFNFHSFFVALCILKKEKPDIVHTNNLGGLSFSVFWAVKLLNIPIIHTLRDCHLLCPYANFTCPFTKFNICKNRPFPCRIFSRLKKAVVDNIPDLITGPSRAIIDIHRKYGFFKKVSAKVIPNFIEIAEDKPALFNKTGKDTLDILYVGRLSKEKGVDFLIKAFKDLEEDFLRLHIVGDGNERRFLENLTEGDKRVVFYGKVSQQEIGKFYQIAGFLAVPSLCLESFGVIAIEAFSSGVPVIGSRIGGIQEIIEDEFNGFLFNLGDKEDLKSKIRLFIEDFKKGGDLLKTFSENAYESSRRYSEGAVLSQVLDIYTGLLRDKGPVR